MTFGHGGKIDISGIQPQQRKLITDEQLKQTVQRVLSHHGEDSEVFVIFQFKSKNGAPLIDKGQVLARQQFALNEYKFPELKTAEGTNVTKEETNTYIKLMANGTDFSVGKRSGLIDYLNVDGQRMLQFRESITPEFWRAPTDNDYGAGLQRRFATWKNPQMRLKSCNVNGNSIVANFDMPDQKATLTMTYTLTNEGEVIIREQLSTDKEARISNMFRYGMQLQMPKQYDRIEYYGRGPIENIVTATQVSSSGYIIIRYRMSISSTFVRKSRATTPTYAGSVCSMPTAAAWSSTRTLRWRQVPCLTPWISWTTA